VKKRRLKEPSVFYEAKQSRKAFWIASPRKKHTARNDELKWKFLYTELKGIMLYYFCQFIRENVMPYFKKIVDAALKNDGQKTLDQLLENKFVNIDECNHDGKTPASFLAAESHLTAAEALNRRGAAMMEIIFGAAYAPTLQNERYEKNLAYAETQLEKYNFSREILLDAMIKGNHEAKISVDDRKIHDEFIQKALQSRHIKNQLDRLEKEPELLDSIIEEVEAFSDKTIEDAAVLYKSPFAIHSLARNAFITDEGAAIAFAKMSDLKSAEDYRKKLFRDMKGLELKVGGHFREDMDLRYMFLKELLESAIMHGLTKYVERLVIENYVLMYAYRYLATTVAIPASEKLFKFLALNFLKYHKWQFKDDTNRLSNAFNHPWIVTTFNKERINTLMHNLPEAGNTLYPECRLLSALLISITKISKEIQMLALEYGQFSLFEYFAKKNFSKKLFSKKSRDELKEHLSLNWPTQLSAYQSLLQFKDPLMRHTFLKNLIRLKIKIKDIDLHQLVNRFHFREIYKERYTVTDKLLNAWVNLEIKIWILQGIALVKRKQLDMDSFLQILTFLHPLTYLEAKHLANHVSFLYYQQSLEELFQKKVGNKYTKFFNAVTQPDYKPAVNMLTKIKTTKDHKTLNYILRDGKDEKIQSKKLRNAMHHFTARTAKHFDQPKVEIKPSEMKNSR